MIVSGCLSRPLCYGRMSGAISRASNLGGRRSPKTFRKARFRRALICSSCSTCTAQSSRIHLMNSELSLALKSVEAMSSVRHPWLWSDQNFGSAIGHAASFVFASARTGSARSELYEPALYELRRHFDARGGGWPDFSNKTGTLSVEVTAMALHALKVADVPDWEHYASPAAQWLWDQQHQDGYWFERGSPDPSGSRSSYQMLLNWRVVDRN